LIDGYNNDRSIMQRLYNFKGSISDEDGILGYLHTDIIDGIKNNIKIADDEIIGSLVDAQLYLNN